MKSTLIKQSHGTNIRYAHILILFHREQTPLNPSTKYKDPQLYANSLPSKLRVSKARHLYTEREKRDNAAYLYYGEEK